MANYGKENLSLEKESNSTHKLDEDLASFVY
jgi:hypothetical protein